MAKMVTHKNGGHFGKIKFSEFLIMNHQIRTQKIQKCSKITHCQVFDCLNDVLLPKIRTFAEINISNENLKPHLCATSIPTLVCNQLRQP